MTPHTPGPWHVERIPESARLERLLAGPFIIRSGTNGRVITELFHVNASDEEPNARLIAAAPEMLALIQYVATSKCKHPDDPQACHFCAARALLARIEGKETP